MVPRVGWRFFWRKLVHFKTERNVALAFGVCVSAPICKYERNAALFPITPHSFYPSSSTVLNTRAPHAFFFWFSSIIFTGPVPLCFVFFYISPNPLFSQSANGICNEAKTILRCNLFNFLCWHHLKKSLLWFRFFQSRARTYSILDVYNAMNAVCIEIFAMHA